MYLYILHLHVFQFKGVLHFINVPTQWSIGSGQMAIAVLFVSVSVVQVRDAYPSSSASFA